MKFLTAFNLVTRLTLLWAFASLAFFANLHGIAVGLFIGLFALACLSRDRNISINPNLWLVVSILVICGALYGWFVIGERFYSVVYVFLYLALNKLWTGTRNRDYLQLYGLSFFLMLATAVSTSSVFFAIALVVYLFLVLTSLITVTIKDDAERALLQKGQKRHRIAGMLRRRRDVRARPKLVVTTSGSRNLDQLFEKQYLTRAYLKWLSGALIFILMVTSLVFTIIPRVQARNYFAGIGSTPGTAARSGFSDTVEFNAMGEIQTNPAIVMRAIPGRGWRFDGSRPSVGILRMRGTSLDHFDGRRWEKGSNVAARLRIDDRARVITFWGTALRPLAFHSEPRFVTTIQTQPTNRGFLFGPDRPTQYFFDFDVSAQIDMASESVQAPPWAETMTYRVESANLSRDWYEKSRSENKRVGNLRTLIAAHREAETTPRIDPIIIRQLSRLDAYEDQIRDIYLQLPDIDDMGVIRQLADEWTLGEEDPLLTVRKIENRLRLDYGYSLNVDFSQRADHLSHFLTVVREAHCEYFATAMVLMLRAKGIPARIVNGYATDEWVNSGGGYFLVRQEHAHSWVEAWFPSAGWITFDPTPSAGIGANRVPSTLYRAFTRWMDSMRLVWYRSVIDYSSQDQVFLYATIYRILNAIPTPSSIMDGTAFRGGGSGTFSSRQSMLLVGVTIAMILLTFFILREARKLARTGRLVLASTHLTSNRRTRQLVYLQLLEALGTIEPRPSSQTPMEYARRISTLRQDLTPIINLTGKYYSTRFSDLAWTEEDTHTARELLRKVRSEKILNGMHREPTSG